MKRRSKKTLQQSRKTSRCNPTKNNRNTQATGKIFALRGEGLAPVVVNPHRWGKPKGQAPLPHWLIDDPIIL